MFLSYCAYGALIICLLGTGYRIVRWFALPLGPEARSTSGWMRVTAVVKALAVMLRHPQQFMRMARAVLMEVLFQMHILRQSALRWAMHMMLFYGMLLLLLMHTLDDQFSAYLFSDYASTLNPFLFLRNLPGLLILAGVIIAWTRRRRQRVSGARILAMASKKEMAVMTPCKCCYGSLKQADYWMRQNEKLRDRVNGLLKTDGLQWSEGVIVHHLLTALSQDVTLKRLKAHITHPLNGIRLAAHYGCHALRPGDVTRFDNPLAPTLFEKVLETTGAEAVQWPLRLECCGQPLWDKNRPLSLALMARKRSDAIESGAKALITACTYCQLQFGQVLENDPMDTATHPELPAILISQLLAIAMGVSPADAGLTKFPIK